MVEYLPGIGSFPLFQSLTLISVSYIFCFLLAYNLHTYLNSPRYKVIFRRELQFIDQISKSSNYPIQIDWRIRKQHLRILKMDTKFQQINPITLFEFWLPSFIQNAWKPVLDSSFNFNWRHVKLKQKIFNSDQHLFSRKNHWKPYRAKLCFPWQDNHNVSKMNFSLTFTFFEQDFLLCESDEKIHPTKSFSR